MVAKRSSRQVARGDIHCPRCNGRMVFEKFYGQGNIFSGLHCVTCGDILDPVILLHRVTRNAEVEVPEREEDVILLVKKYMKSKPKVEKSCITRPG